MKNYVCFTDGSFLSGTGEVHGSVVFTDHEANVLTQMHLYTTLPAIVSMNNVGGEVMAAAAAIQSVINTIKKEQEDGGGLESYKLTLIYDYQGVGMWATGKWAAKKPGSAWFKNTVKSLIESVPNFTVDWVWTKGHQSLTGNYNQDIIITGNKHADRAAAYDMVYTKQNNIPVICMDQVIVI